MTIVDFEGNGKCTDFKEKTDIATGYPIYYRDIVVNGRTLLPGDLIYVKDYSLGVWYPARYVYLYEEICARPVDANRSTSWRYALIPEEVEAEDTYACKHDYEFEPVIDATANFAMRLAKRCKICGKVSNIFTEAEQEKEYKFHKAIEDELKNEEII